MTASGSSTGAPSPSPGSGKTTSGGECSVATPCFVCRVKALVAAQGVDGDFHDDPFTINIVGIRRANSITDKFDDRVIVFFSLPAADATKTLKDGGIEGAGDDNLITDINDAAAAVNKGSKDPFRGVRRVPCSRVELEAGKPAAGDRVVLMYPITTDPGLVRLKKSGKDSGDLLLADVKKGQDQIEEAKKHLAELEDAKKKLVDELLPNLKKAGDDLTKTQAKYPKLKKGEQPTQDVVDAAKKVDDAKKAIDALAAKLKDDLQWKAMPKALTDKELDKQIAAQKKDIDNLNKTEKAKQDAYDKWSSPNMSEAEQEKFEGYHYVFKTKEGDWEGDDHALFPTGHMKDAFRLYLHHSASKTGTPALTIGEYLGERVITGHTLKLDFEGLVAYPRGLRLAPVHDKVVKASKAREKAFKQALDKVDKNGRKALLAQQDVDRKAAQAQDDATEEEAGREYLVLDGTRPADGFTPPPGGTRIARTCEVKSGDGTQPLPLGDRFVLKGDPRHTRTGQDICDHYHDLLHSTKSTDSLVIDTHFPSGDGVPLPAKSKIVAGAPVFDSGGTQTPIPDDVVLIVEAMVGGTNLHRGHVLEVKGGKVSATYENADKVSNWSTGCQVWPYFLDYNLFILVAGLSKRWKCLHGSPPPTCPRIKTGTDSAPDPFVWANALTDASLHSKKLKAQMKDDTVSLQKQRAQAQSDVMSKVDAWFKSQKQKRPKKDADAEDQAVAWYNQQASALAAKVDADKAAVTAAGPPSSDAAKAAQTTLDQDTAQQKTLTDAQQDLATAIDARDDLDNRLGDLDGVLSGLDTKSDIYPVKHDLLAGQAKAMGDRAADLADEPEPQKAALAVQAAAQALVDALPKEAYDRATLMRHDWMRTCDLHYDPKNPWNDPNQCPQRFSYTLIELSPGDPAGKMPGVEALDAEFSKQAGGADAYPKWNGFDVK